MGAGITFYFRASIKNKDHGYLFAKLHKKGVRQCFSLDFKIPKSLWDYTSQRIIVSSEFPDIDYTPFNVFLNELSDEFHKEYVGETMAGFSPDIARIKRNLIAKFFPNRIEKGKSISYQLRPLKERLNTKKMTRALADPYIRIILKKSGFPDYFLDSLKKQLFEIKRGQIITLRLLKTKQNDN
jgi:hypothetical protein